MINNQYRIYKIPNFRDLYDILIRTKYDMYGEVQNGELLLDAKDDYEHDAMNEGIISMLKHHDIEISHRKIRHISSICDARTNVLDYVSELKLARHIYRVSHIEKE